MVAGVKVKTPTDSRATTSCCSQRWYRRYHVEVGPLIQDQTQLIGVENTPIFVDGRTVRLPLEWKDAVTTVSFFVVPTLIEPGMDLLQRLGVKINTKVGVAEPTVLVSHIQPPETWRVPAGNMEISCFKLRIPSLGRTRVFYSNLVKSCQQI